MNHSASCDVEGLVRDYYRALEGNQPLAGFYATDAEAGAFGPPVKVGTGDAEVFVGYQAIAGELERGAATFARNRLGSRALLAHRRGDLGWFFDQVWWAGEADGQPFASLTRWTGVCVRCPGGWKLVQLHVSEGAGGPSTSTT